MYSIHVFLTNNKSVEFLLGSASSLSFVYQPAKILNLNAILSLSEDNDLLTTEEFNEFNSDLACLLEFWNKPNQSIKSVRPSEGFIEELRIFYKKIKPLALIDIKSISLC